MGPSPFPNRVVGDKPPFDQTYELWKVAGGHSMIRCQLALVHTEGDFKKAKEFLGPFIRTPAPYA